MAKRKRSNISRRKQKRRRQQNRTLIIIGGIIALAVLGVVLIVPGAASAGDPERIALDPILGNEAATITITEYGDFGCPSCRAWHNAGIREQVLATYGDRVKFVFKDFPVITAQSPRAAEAGQCALDQGLFWEFHDTVYENFEGLSDSNLTVYAAISGLDVDAFTECLDSKEHLATVRADWDEALRLGLRGTPSFAINGQPIAGVPSFEVLAVNIEALLGG